MAKKRAQTAATEPDSAYFLKIILYFVLGSIWIKLGDRPVVPVGLILGLLFSSHEHFRIDKKVEYAVLVVAAALAFLGLGIFLVINS